MRRRIISTAAMVCLFFGGLRAASFAKYAGEFMSTGVGARALGMGGAYVAGGGDVTYGFWNPAGISFINYPELAVMHSERFAGMVNYDYAGIALPWRKKEGAALSIIRLGVDDIPYTTIPRPDLHQDETYIDENGNLRVNRPYVYKSVSDAEYAVYLSYGAQRSRTAAFGINAKVVHKGVGDHSAWGIGFDIAALWNPWRRLMVGVNLQDATTTLLAWNTNRRELIAPTLKSGIAYPLLFPQLKSRVLFALDADIRFEGREFASMMHVGPAGVDLRLGAEFNFRNIAALRIGRDDLGFFTAGAGIVLPRLNIDYAFMNHTDLKETHRISLRLRLEEERFKRK